MARKGPAERAPRRCWPAAEKRRIVELTLRAGASVHAIAGEYGLNPNGLYHWRRLYRAGKLDGREKSLAGVGIPVASARFLPVSVVPELRQAQSALREDAGACRGSIMQLVLASGATLRIETGALDAALVCALVAELRR